MKRIVLRFAITLEGLWEGFGHFCFEKLMTVVTLPTTSPLLSPQTHHFLSKVSNTPQEGEHQWGTEWVSVQTEED